MVRQRSAVLFERELRVLFAAVTCGAFLRSLRDDVHQAREEIGRSNRRTACVCGRSCGRSGGVRRIGLRRTREHAAKNVRGLHRDLRRRRLRGRLLLDYLRRRSLLRRALRYGGSGLQLLQNALQNRFGKRKRTGRGLRTGRIFRLLLGRDFSRRVGVQDFSRESTLLPRTVEFPRYLTHQFREPFFEGGLRWWPRARRRERRRQCTLERAPADWNGCRRWSCGLQQTRKLCEQVAAVASRALLVEFLLQRRAEARRAVQSLTVRGTFMTEYRTCGRLSPDG